MKPTAADYATGLALGVVCFNVANLYAKHISIINHANLGFSIHTFAFMVILMAILNMTNILPENVKAGARGMQQFFVKYMSFPLMITVGIGTNLTDYAKVFTNPAYIVIIMATVIGAPGRPTFLNPDEDYFWGIRDFKDYFGYDVDLEAVKKVPVLISVGELDNKFIGDSPYGDNRVARMKSLQKNFQEHGVHTELTILPGFAHEAGEKERVQAAQKFFIQYL